ncbi:MAG: aminoacetone oxidase family FAD-binding enzyme [Oscillospiraceae bacterium]|nr:aminoacetone oxidase family FAD-binding enzyme [Oscillospiraceae bacterium]
MTDVIVVGAGAAGMAFSILAKRQNPNLEILLIESRDRVGKKLITTGNGRCNITNSDYDIMRYHGKNPQFANSALSGFPPAKQAEFFSSLGVLVDFEQDGRAYPLSGQASSVVDALRFALDELGVEVLTSTSVNKIKKSDNAFIVNTEGNDYYCHSVVIACGGIAGGKLGNESGYTLLKSLGHLILERRPSIVQIRTDLTFVKQLKGIKVTGNVSVLDNGNKLKTEFGEILFCEYGLSGPAILQLSRLISFNQTSEISLDFVPAYSEFDLVKMMLIRKSDLSLRPVSEFFTGFLNKRLGQVIAKYCEIDIRELVSDLTTKEIAVLAHTIKEFRIAAIGTTGMSNAQVTAGGADTDQFFDTTLMSKKTKGLFAIGEVLDIDGDCGGFNLSWSWASANAAANGVCKYIKELNK